MIDLILEYWDWFLFDTLLWTGALIALALVLRRPVARHLGAGATYALWFLPLLRLLFPPVRLPLWMRPALFETEAPALATEDFAAAPAAPAADVLPLYDPSYSAATAPVPMDSPLDFTVPLIALWLAGALIFMIRRFWLYGRLRRDLLAEARPVGEIGRIRLIETPVISGPMAFGVLDKVIALPAGFMTMSDRLTRDLAIAHELAHHRGHDLLVNVLVQPLFALHWFNPLGWMGWNAMRRDQEAACDARVVSSRSRDERAAYAAVIADFARRPQSAPRPALAAPMACPVLGDKSIIHRLRSLPMTDDSRRRRLAARGAVAAALLALPMTASICYSEASAAPPPAPVAPVAPSAPAAPFAPAPPVAPLAPEPPAAGEAVIEFDLDWEEVQEDMEEARRDLDEAREELRENEREMREHRTEAYAEGRKAWAESRIEYARDRKQWADGRIQWAEGRVQHAEARAKRAEARAVAHADWDEDMSDAIAESVAAAVASVPQVVESCRYPDNPVTPIQKGEKTVMYVCDTAGDRIALKALEQARRGIAGNDSLSEEIRRDILRDIDDEIRDLRKSVRG